LEEIAKEMDLRYNTALAAGMAAKSPELRMAIALGEDL
jgi:hypothetical protein